VTDLAIVGHIGPCDHTRPCKTAAAQQFGNEGTPSGVPFARGAFDLANEIVY
jgi:hypothetical protein